MSICAPFLFAFVCLLISHSVFLSPSHFPSNHLTCRKKTLTNNNTHRHAARLVYTNIGNKFRLELHLSGDRSPSRTHPKAPVTAYACVDLGLRNPAAVASTEGNVLLGEDSGFRLLQMQREVDGMQGTLATLRNLLQRPTLTKDERRRVRHSLWQVKMAMVRKTLRIKHIAREIARSTAHLICSAAVVICPSLAVAEMNKGLTKKWKRISSLLSISKLQKAIQDLADRLGRKFVDADESGSTSQ